jgi:mono/diheme cytochrome c family protein
MKSLGRKTIIAGLIAIAAGFAFATYAQNTPDALFQSKCSTCHGADGSGNTPAGRAAGAKDFRDPEVVKEVDVELQEVIERGRKKMPGYQGKLSEDQVDALVRYIRQLQGT